LNSEKKRAEASEERAAASEEQQLLKNAQHQKFENSKKNVAE
jgi:hypothetical protein